MSEIAKKSKDEESSSIKSKTKLSSKSQRFSSSKFLGILIVTVAVFVTGVFLGVYANSFKLDVFNNQKDMFDIKTRGAELSLDILKEMPCSVVSNDFLSKQLYDLGDKVSYLEKQLGEDSSTTKLLKEEYMVTQIEHWLFMKNKIDSCGLNSTAVLFFYSNEKSQDASSDQGFVLSYLRKKLNIYVYSIDMDIPNPAVLALIDSYGVLSSPAIVVEDNLYTGYRTPEEVIEIFKSQNLTIERKE